MISLRPTLALVVVSLACGVASARADEHLAFVSGGGPIAAAGGTVAYSTPGTDGRYRLMLSTGGGAGAPAPGVARSGQPFDVALGRSGAKLVATYSRNGRAYVLPLGGGAERRMRTVTGPAAWPVVAGDRVAWIVPGAAGNRGCDRLAVRSGKGRVRIISRACRRLSGLQIRGKDVVWSSTDISEAVRHGAGPKSSSIKAFRFGGDVRTIDTVRFGEESNLLASPVIAGADVVYAQTGVNPRKSFVSAPLDGRHAPVRVAAGAALAGPLAVDGARALYVIAGHGEEGCTAQTQLAPVPCELISTATADLRAGAVRLLPAELSVGYTPGTRPPAGTPLTVAGTLVRRTVRDGVTISTAPVAGEVVDVLSRAAPAPSDLTPETFTPTGASATTGADGRWSVTVGAPDLPFFTAQVRSSGLLAGRGTVGYCPAGTTALPGGCIGPAR